MLGRLRREVAIGLGLIAGVVHVCSGPVLAALRVTSEPSQTPSAAPRVPGPPATPLRAPLRVAAIAAELDRRVPGLLAEGMVPGLSIALVSGGRVAWSRGYGVANAETKQPVTDRTVFEAASLSKPVFAYAVLQLVDRGLIDLDTPLTRYLPGPYDVVDDPRVNQITARLVLSHRSGFPNWRSGPRNKPPLPIHFTPGERFSYSGEGFVYLAKVVEHLRGQPFDDFMRATVFGPLGMISSSYVWQEPYAALKAFNHDPFGSLAGRGQPLQPNAAASLHTTASDYARFVAAVLDGNGLSEATARAMLAPQSELREGGPNTITRVPGARIPELAWGLGIGLQRTSDGPSFWHWGDNGSQKAFVIAFERPKTAMVVFTNGANGLRLVPDLVRMTVGGQVPALDWLDYGTLASPGQALLREIARDGAAKALAAYRQRRAARPAAGALTEDEVNGIGYAFLRAKRTADAVEVFRLNVEDHPDSSNAHDSLGEGYAANGDRELAIRHYRRSLELDPNNTGAVEALKKLEAVK